MASVKEVSIEDMSEKQRFVVYDNIAAEHCDPLELIQEIEELAIEAGWASVHDFIQYHLNNTH